jgi:hypothetical protein
MDPRMKFQAASIRKLRPNLFRGSRSLSVVLLGALLAGCGGEFSTTPISVVKSCQDSPEHIATLADGDRSIFVFQDGNFYVDSSGGCIKVGSYFTPGFDTANYTRVANSFFLKTSKGMFPLRDRFSESFQRYAGLGDLFVQSIGDTDKIWTAMTLQSPSAPPVAEYVALRKCVLDGTCTFRDNRIDLVFDPSAPSNQVLKFTSVAPSKGMVTSKASIESSLSHFTSGEDLWFRARYLFSDSLPYSIADFESEWFLESPGPRIVFDNGALAIEDKFGSKAKFRQTNPVAVPRNKWVAIQVHLHFDPSAGTIELWQDGVKLIATTGPTLPLSFAIQTNIEIGITATNRACTVYMDDVEWSKTSFPD